MKSTARRKKALSILLLVAMLCSFATVNAYAAGGASHFFGSGASPGERVTVYVNLDSNRELLPFRRLLHMTVTSTLVSASNADSFRVISQRNASDKIRMVWVGRTPEQARDSTVTGRLATLVLSIQGCKAR